MSTRSLIPETTRMLPLRLAIAASVAGFGANALIALARIPAGIARGRPGVLIREIIFDPAFWTTMVLCSLGIALALLFSIHLLARSYRMGRLQAMRILEPLAWGAGLPAVALLLDPWWFWSTAPPLAAAGVGLGAISTRLRFREARGDLGSPGLDDRTYIVGLALIAVLIPTLMVSPGSPWWPSISGDEPHYLVIARSIWTDHDINLANDYGEKLHWDFYPADLAPHARVGRAPGTLHSMHSVGLGLWLAPWFGIGEMLSRRAFTLLVRFSMTLWLGAFAAVLFLLLRDITGSRAAVRGTLLAVLTAPLLFASPHLFAEVPALTLSASAYLVLRRSPGVRGALFAGLILALLPWLHFKYFALMAAVAASGVWYLLRGSPNGNGTTRSQIRVLVALGLPLLLSGAAHALFTWQLYGRLSPLAVQVGTGLEARAPALGYDYLGYLLDPWAALRTGIGHLLDQKEGLLFYAPHYLLAVAGLAWLWRQRRGDAVTLVLCLTSLWVPYALSRQFGHWAPPARPLTSVVWTLAVPMGIGLALSRGPGGLGRLRAVLRGILVASGLGVTLLLLVQSHLLYHDHNISLSLMLQRYGAPGLPLWAAAPLWAYYQQPQWIASILWLLAFVLAGALLWRWGWEAASIPLEQGGHGSGEENAAPGGAPGHAAARVWVIVATAALLLHHLLVPVTGLHIRHDNGPVGVWVSNIPQGRAWHSASGTWVGGDDSVELLLSSRAPLNTITAEIQAISAMRVEVQVGRDRQNVGLEAGEETLVRFVPGPGRRWQGESFYHFRFVVPGGTSHAALGINPGDPRTLGVLVHVLEAR